VIDAFQVVSLPVTSCQTKTI